RSSSSRPRPGAGPRRGTLALPPARPRGPGRAPQRVVVSRQGKSATRFEQEAEVKDVRAGFPEDAARPAPPGAARRAGRAGHTRSSRFPAAHARGAAGLPRFPEGEPSPATRSPATRSPPSPTSTTAPGRRHRDDGTGARLDNEEQVLANRRGQQGRP